MSTSRAIYSGIAFFHSRKKASLFTIFKFRRPRAHSGEMFHSLARAPQMRYLPSLNLPRRAMEMSPRRVWATAKTHNGETGAGERLFLSRRAEKQVAGIFQLRINKAPCSAVLYTIPPYCCHLPP